jgi:hypothetical protein
VHVEPPQDPPIVLVQNDSFSVKGPVGVMVGVVVGVVVATD